MMMQPSWQFAAPDHTLSETQHSWTIHSKTEIPYLRKQCAQFATRYGFSRKATIELVIAVSELLTNSLKFGKEATLSIRYVKEERCGIQITLCDNGPGFDDIEMAKIDGFSEGRLLAQENWIKSRNGLGNGLGAAIRMTDRLELCNLPTGGACATIWKWLPIPKSNRVAT